MNLRSLDETWLPRAAAVVQGMLARARTFVTGYAGPGTHLGEAARRQPALLGSIGAVAVAAIVLVAAGGPGEPHDHDSGAPSPVPTSFGSSGALVTTLGPTPGTSIANYLRRAAVDLHEFATKARGHSGYAIVDLRNYVTPTQAATMFNGVEVVRAYVRVPAPNKLPTQVHAIPLQSTFGALDQGMLASGRLASATASTFHVLVAQLKPRNPQDKLLRTRYALQEQASAFEAQRLQTPDRCGCVFAIVVHAPLPQLLALAHATGVRVVDPASIDVTLDALTVFPLEPEIAGVVPRSGLFGA